jgi:hypothetical protein
LLNISSDAGIQTPVHRIGWPDQFIEHASSVDYLRQKYGLTAAAAVKAVAHPFRRRIRRRHGTSQNSGRGVIFVLRSSRGDEALTNFYQHRIRIDQSLVTSAATL